MNVPTPNDTPRNPFLDHPQGGAMTPTRNRSNLNTVVILTVCGVLAAVAGAGVALRTTPNAGQFADRIAPGVSVADIPVGGLSKETAQAKVRSWAKGELANHTITLVGPESQKRYQLLLADAGGRFETESAIDQAYSVGRNETYWDTLLRHGKEYSVNVVPAFKLDEKTLTGEIASVGERIKAEPKNARVAMVGGTLRVTTPEQKGVALDVDATKAALLKDGPDALRAGAEVPMVITETAPKLTDDDMAQVNTLLASYHTDFGSSAAARQSNIRKAAGKIDGALLAPGEIFSYNDTVGPRLKTLGWRDAPTYQDGQVVPGPGGGICQTSTTLYNAALRAGLKIVERVNHSMPVHYVTPGCDATVDYGAIDFRFANSTPGPLYVQASAKGGRLVFSLYGVSAAVPGKIDIETGEHHPKPDGGFTVASYRVRHAEDGTVNREYLGTSSYRPVPTRAEMAAYALKMHPPKKAHTTLKRFPAPLPTPNPADIAR